MSMMKEFAKNMKNVTAYLVPSGCAVCGVERHWRTKFGNQWLIRRENNQGITHKHTHLAVKHSTFLHAQAVSSVWLTYSLKMWVAGPQEKNKKQLAY